MDTRFCHGAFGCSSIQRRTAVVLLALAWSSPVFSGGVLAAVQSAELGQIPASPPPVSTQGEVQGAEPTATLKGGTMCFPRGAGLRCEPNNLATKMFGDRTPRLELIDGKGPLEYGKGRGLGSTYNSRWDAGFSVPLTAGRHSITVSFFLRSGSRVSQSERVGLAFVAVSGHAYSINSLVANPLAPNRWLPLVFDETDKTVVQTSDSPAGSLIHDAAATGDLAQVAAVLKDSPDLVFSKDKNGNTPLHWAAQNDHKDIVALLLASGADVNAQADNGTTPLHDAADKGNRDVVELLLASKADVNRRANNGATPLHKAASTGHKDVAELLLAHKADVNARAANGGVPLHDATYKSHRDVVEVLLANKADVNARMNNGLTPLHNAALNGNKDIVELLLANQADVNARDKKGATPLRDAMSNRHKVVAELLRERGGHK
jgi:ankyrin repeat protein